MYKLPERRGGGGGGGIWAMPERKHFFFHEVFPYIHPTLFGCEENIFLSFKLLICEFLSNMPVWHIQDVVVLCPV